MIIDAAELRRRYLLRIAGARDEKVYIGPRLVALNITDSCNLRCRYCCSIHAPGNPHHLKKKYFLSWKTFIEIVRDCVDLKVDQINITGRGDPTMHPLFRDMMRHMEQQPLKVTVFTNGTFPLDYCSDIMKADQIRINIGAVDPEQYLDLHGKDRFNHVMANIKRLAALRDAGKPRFLIDIAYVVNSVNISQKKQMQELACRLGVHRVHFIKMSPSPYNKGVALANSFLEDKERKAPAACLNGWFNIVVTPDGKIEICARLHQMSYGDLNIESFKNILRLPYMMKLRLLGKYGQIPKKYKDCQDCPYHGENMQGLRALERFRKK